MSSTNYGLFELSDFILIPSCNASSTSNVSVDNLLVQDRKELFRTFPIFVDPELVSHKYYRKWAKSGLRPIIPLTDPIECRLHLCNNVFCAFTIQEIDNYFISNKFDTSNSHCQYKIYIQNLDNEHSSDLVSIASCLKGIYQDRVLLMTGPIQSPSVFPVFAQAGYDYVIAGHKDKSSPFYYPAASMIGEILSWKSNSSKSCNLIFVTDFKSQDEVLKALVMGADYVMIGSLLSNVIDVISDNIYFRDPEKKSNHVRSSELELVNDPSSLSKEALKAVTLYRIWRGSWIKLDSSISDWSKGFVEFVRKAFVLTNSQTWIQLRKNIIFKRKI